MYQKEESPGKGREKPGEGSLAYLTIGIRRVGPGIPDPRNHGLQNQKNEKGRSDMESQIHQMVTCRVQSAEVIIQREAGQNQRTVMGVKSGLMTESGRVRKKERDIFGCMDERIFYDVVDVIIMEPVFERVSIDA